MNRQVFSFHLHQIVCDPLWIRIKKQWSTKIDVYWELPYWIMTDKKLGEQETVAAREWETRNKCGKASRALRSKSNTLASSDILHLFDSGASPENSGDLKTPLFDRPRHESHPARVHFRFTCNNNNSGIVSHTSTHTYVHACMYVYVHVNKDKNAPNRNRERQRQSGKYTAPDCLEKPKSKQSKIKYTAKTYFAATATAMATSKAAATATATAKRQSNRKPISQHVLVASPTSSLLKCLSLAVSALCRCSLSLYLSLFVCLCDSVSSFHFLLHLAKAALSCAKDDGDSDSRASFQSSIAVVVAVIIIADVVVVVVAADVAVVCGAAQNCREIPLA